MCWVIQFLHTLQENAPQLTPSHNSTLNATQARSSSWKHRRKRYSRAAPGPLPPDSHRRRCGAHRAGSRGRALPLPYCTPRSGRRPAPPSHTKARPARRHFQLPRFRVQRRKKDGPSPRCMPGVEVFSRLPAVRQPRDRTPYPMGQRGGALLPPSPPAGRCSSPRVRCVSGAHAPREDGSCRRTRLREGAVGAAVGTGPGPGCGGSDRAVPDPVPAQAGAEPAAPGPDGGLRFGGGVDRAVLRGVRWVGKRPSARGSARPCGPGEGRSAEGRLPAGRLLCGGCPRCGACWFWAAFVQGRESPYGNCGSGSESFSADLSPISLALQHRAEKTFTQR